MVQEPANKSETTLACSAIRNQGSGYRNAGCLPKSANVESGLHRTPRRAGAKTARCFVSQLGRGSPFRCAGFLTSGSFSDRRESLGLVRRFLQSPSLFLASTIAVMSVMPAHAADTLAGAIKEGDATLSFRLRYEDVTDKSAAEDANALTLKTRLNYKTGDFNGISALVEFDDVTELDEVDYNAVVDGPSTATKIVDPEGTEVNQAYLAFSGLDKTVIKAGRQRILLDNQRFVGGVGFRQNEQTYDALTLTNKSLPDTTLFYGYVGEVNGIVGKATKHDTHLLNAKYTGFDAGALTAYYYNFAEDKVGGYDLDTYGVRFAGATKVSDASKLLYTVEYASQDNGTTEPDYYVVEGGVAFSGVTTKIGYEVLGSDGGIGFNTPLATKHKFQGWADQFLGTPGNGIEDLYLTVGTTVAGVKLLAVYHDYESEASSADLGSEYGFIVAKKLGKNYGLSLKYSSYDASAESGKADKSKLWLTATAKF